MSTARRRPTGGARKPQVAGRPRTAQQEPDAESASGAGGGLAVGERGTPPPTGRAGTRPGPPGVDRVRPAGPAPASRDAAAREAVGPDASTRTGQVDAPATAEQADTPAPAERADAPPEARRAAPVTAGGTGERTRGGLAGLLRRVPTPPLPTGRRAAAALLAVTVLLAAAAAFFAFSFVRLEFTGASRNTALTDVGTTAAVSEQVGDAVKKVYSFDFARLDQAEADARANITGPFSGQFDQIFGNVRQLAPKQQAVVTATIPKSAVASIEGDRATVYVFVNQVIRRVDGAGKPQQGAAAARLRVDAQYVDGRWKISGMSPA